MTNGHEGGNFLPSAGIRVDFPHPGNIAISPSDRKNGVAHLHVDHPTNGHDSLDKVVNKPLLREQALKGEYDPARDDPSMQYELGRDVQVPFLRPVLPMQELLHLKDAKNLKICLVIPCKNEGTKAGQKKSNIGTTLDNLLPLKEAGLVDKLWVISNSTDDTELEVRRRNGVDFTRSEDMLAAQKREHKPGKGTNLNLAVTEHTNDDQLLVFCDADFGAKPSQIQGVISPLIENQNTQMSLAWLARLTKQGDPDAKLVTGGRATRFTFKPLLRSLYPELDGLQQPICGLYAARGSALKDVEFTSDYGIETALITQVADNHGAEAFAQTYCGTKTQTGQTHRKIESMADQITNEFILRAIKAGRKPVPVTGRTEFHISREQGEKPLIVAEHIVYERDRLAPPAQVNLKQLEEQPQPRMQLVAAS